MRPAPALLLLSLAACKEQGPTAEQLEAARKKACAVVAPRLQAAFEAAQALDALSPPPTKVDAPLARPLELWTFEELEACAKRVVACEDEPPSACAEPHGYLRIRLTTDAPVEVNEAMLNKYTGGRQAGDALAYDLGSRAALGAVVFDVKLHGGVDVERDATTEQRALVLNAALKAQVREAIEAKLQPAR